MKKTIFFSLMFVLLALGLQNSAFAAISTTHFVEVEKGDSLYSIAKGLKINFAKFVEANRTNLRYRENPDLIYPGQILDIPLDVTMAKDLVVHPNVAKDAEESMLAMPDPAKLPESDAAAKPVRKNADKSTVVNSKAIYAQKENDVAYGNWKAALSTAMDDKRTFVLFLTFVTFLLVFLVVEEIFRPNIKRNVRLNSTGSNINLSAVFRWDAEKNVGLQAINIKFLNRCIYRKRKTMSLLFWLIYLDQ